MLSLVRRDKSAHLERNRQAHQQKWGMVPRWVSGDEVRVEGPVDRNGTCLPERAYLFSADEGWTPVHDCVHPMSEAVRWLEQAAGARPLPETVCVIGAGLGFVIEAIADRSDSRILVLEPDPALVPWFFERRDWRPLIDSGRLLVLAGPDYEGAAHAWRVFGSTTAAPLVLVHPVLGRARLEATRLAGTVIGRARKGAIANEEARRKFETPYLVNTLQNVRTIARSPSVDRLFGRHRSEPVVLAAAGPSLNRNLEELRPHRDRVVLVAVDTALKPLLAAGMAPDYVVALDPGESNARHLVDAVVPASTALVAEGSIAPRSFRPFGDNIYIFRVADHAPWSWLKVAGIERGLLRAWGSVVTSAFDLAVRMGGDPVVLVGADLSYTGGQLYCRGTTYEADWRDTAGADRSVEWVWKTVIEQRSVAARGVGHIEVPTSPYLLAFRDWLLEESQRPGMPRLVNATGAGILDGGGFIACTCSSQPLSGWLSSGEPTRDDTIPIRTPAVQAPADPCDAHLLRALMSSREPPSATVAPRLTPYMQRPRRERIASTRELCATRSSDIERWRETDNLDPSWERRAQVVARLIPPASRVLDLGAGLEALARHLPPDCTYTPADLIPRSPRTVVVDLNAGEFPEGRFDVVAAVGVLEYIHDVRGLLWRIRSDTSMLVMSYCACVGDGVHERLQRGWINDFSLDELFALCVQAGWQVTFAERLDALPAFDQWIVALRPAHDGRRE